MMQYYRTILSVILLLQANFNLGVDDHLLEVSRLWQSHQGLLYESLLSSQIETDEITEAVRLASLNKLPEGQVLSGSELRKLRRLKRKTQQWVADQLSISLIYVKHIEAGIKDAFETRKRITRLLNNTVSELQIQFDDLGVKRQALADVLRAHHTKKGLTWDAWAQQANTALSPKAVRKRSYSLGYNPDIKTQTQILRFLELEHLSQLNRQIDIAIAVREEVIRGLSGQQASERAINQQISQRLLIRIDQISVEEVLVDEILWNPYYREIFVELVGENLISEVREEMIHLFSQFRAGEYDESDFDFDSFLDFDRNDPRDIFARFDSSSIITTIVQRVKAKTQHFSRLFYVAS